MGTRGFGKFKRKVRKMKRDLNRKPKQAVDRSSTRIVADMKQNVVDNDAVASTELFRGIQYEKTARGGKLKSTADHSAVVEFGTGPRHRPNPYTSRFDTPELSMELVRSLEEWFILKPSRPTPSDPRGAAWGLANRIAGNDGDSLGGTDAQPFFVPAWRRGRHRLLRNVRGAVEDSV